MPGKPDSRDAIPAEHFARTSSMLLIDAAEALPDASCSCGPISYESSWTCAAGCEERVARENLRAVIERERHRY